MYNLTLPQALFIKVIRTRLMCSLRAVHYLFNRRYTYQKPYSPIEGVEDDVMCNQVAGQALCNAAMDKLNEKQEDGWL